MTLVVPSVAGADNGLGDRSQTTHCNNLSGSGSIATQLSGSGTNLVLQQENERGHDSGDGRHGYNSFLLHWFWYWYLYWHRNHCPVDPPADVPEAPQVLMLSGSAVLTGGAAMLIIRRRTKSSMRATA